VMKQGRLARHDRRDEARLALPVERLAPREHLVEHGAEREDVGARVGLHAFELLGRHVLERAKDRPLHRQPGRRRRQHRRTRARCGRGRLRQTEVEELDAPLREHDVGRLQIAVDDALAMRLVERVGNLGPVAKRQIERQRPLVRRTARVSPSRNSMTRKSIPSCAPTSNTGQMCG